jgi:hypothetical protein
VDEEKRKGPNYPYETLCNEVIELLMPGEPALKTLPDSSAFSHEVFR